MNTVTELSPVGAVVADTKGIRGIVGERLTMEAFMQLCGKLGGHTFVKVVVEKQLPKPVIHFINNSRYVFHADYIAENLLKVPVEELDAKCDEFNRSVYLSPDRRFFLGILALHTLVAPAVPGPQPSAAKNTDRFFSLETVEIDNMDADMLRFLYGVVAEHLDPGLPLLFKPANHLQEAFVPALSAAGIPIVFSHELFSKANFIALNPGSARGRLRMFRSEEEFQKQLPTLEWYDIVVMTRVPDDLPRVSGIINADHTTPLSHTNVLAAGWQVPNCIQIGILDRIEKEKLDGRWVTYTVEMNSATIGLSPVEGPVEVTRPAWSLQRIKLDEPEISNVPIVELGLLRTTDSRRYGTKAANLGELKHLLDHPSERMIGFYKVRRPPRANLLPYLAQHLKLHESSPAPALAQAAWEFLRANIQVPRGIAIPFTLQQQFLESSPRIQQAIGKLKMALELGAREVDALCVNLQNLIRATRMSDEMRDRIDSKIADSLSGVSSFVIRSSSNAEDLDKFSAAGIYESINHVTNAENIFRSIKEVWASLVSPRSVRLRQEVGISLDDCYMGVIIQEEVAHASSDTMGGVLVTTNPLDRARDFRNVFLNVSSGQGKSVNQIVQGTAMPYQYLYNTIEGGGRTLSIGDAREDLSEAKRQRLQKLAIVGRLLQSHFSPDYTFASPVDIEWIDDGEWLHILQLRPYAK
jgi:hypothetical protein